MMMMMMMKMIMMMMMMTMLMATTIEETGTIKMITTETATHTQTDRHRDL